MSEIKYTMKLNGTVFAGRFSQQFTEKNVDHIEFSFGNKKIVIGDETTSALKLQKLVKKMIKSNGKDLKHRQKSNCYQGWCAESIIDTTLQSLIEESEK